MVQETSEPGTIGTGPDEGGGEQVLAAPPSQMPASVRRVPLARLLSVVVLSPAQATLLAVRLLDATHARGASDGGHPAHDRLWAAVVTTSGDVEVGYTEPGEGSTTTDLLEQLAQNARRLPAHPRPEQLVLLRGLEETAAGRREPGGRARALEGALAEVLGPGASQRLSGQLGALVRAFAHFAPVVAAPVPVAPVLATPVPVPALDAPAGARPTPSRPGHPRPAHPRPGPRRPLRRGRARGHRRTRTRRTALVVLLLAVALAASGYVVLRDPDTGQGGASGRDDPRAEPAATPGDSTQPAKQRRPRPRPAVESLAARAAGPVTGVQVQPVGTCTPGASCPVTVTVRLSPATTARPVTWRVGTARACGKDIAWSAPLGVTAQPGWTTVYASTSVPVPQGRSFALVALTSAPARAQSPPVPVAGASLRC